MGSAQRPLTLSRAAWLSAAAVALAVVTVVLTCLAFAYRSSAFGHMAWSGVMRRGDRAVSVRSDTAFGKTILTWAPAVESGQSPPDLSADGEGTLEPRDPPRWSSVWRDSAFDEAVAERRRFGSVRFDLAVGWPWRAASCEHGRTGIELPLMIVRDEEYIVGEMRAIPLRPIWAGLVLDISAFAAAWFVVLHWLTRTTTRDPMVRPPPRQVGARPPTAEWSREPRRRSRWIGRWAVDACVLGVLGVISTAVVAVVLPIVVLERSVNLWAVGRIGGCTSDLWWSRVYVQPTPQERDMLNAGEAASVDRSLRSAGFTTHKRQTLLRSDRPEARSFQSFRTGWPFACLWGAIWEEGMVSHQVGVWEVGPPVPELLRRGTDVLPTSPLWRGWIGNTLVYAAVWWAVFVAWRWRRRVRRARRGLCSWCAYDLRDTPIGDPCPECGAETPGAVVVR